MGVMRRKFPHEIKAYKSVMFYGLTARQIICIVCALALAIPTGFICSKLNVDSDTMGYIIMFEVIPFGAAGWLSYNDMALEKFAEQIIKFYFGARRRKWQFQNSETRIHNAIMDIDLEEMSAARKQEIADAKAKAKEEKRSEKQKKKANKKTSGKGKVKEI